MYCIEMCMSNRVTVVVIVICVRITMVCHHPFVHIRIVFGVQCSISEPESFLQLLQNANSNVIRN